MTDGLSYRRARFSTTLPGGRRYTAAHFWIAEEEGGFWRVGFTKFATRMLGEMVEYGFEIEPGAVITTGQIIGWLEGFKATTDLYSVVTGRFESSNDALEGNVDLIRADPYGTGWLYRAHGEPEPDHVDAAGYATLLDGTIDRMLEGEHA